MPEIKFYTSKYSLVVYVEQMFDELDDVYSCYYLNDSFSLDIEKDVVANDKYISIYLKQIEIIDGVFSQSGLLNGQCNYLWEASCLRESDILKSDNYQEYLEALCVLDHLEKLSMFGLVTIKRYGNVNKAVESILVKFCPSVNNKSSAESEGIEYGSLIITTLKYVERFIVFLFLVSINAIASTFSLFKGKKQNDIKRMVVSYANYEELSSPKLCDNALNYWKGVLPSCAYKDMGTHFVFFPSDFTVLFDVRTLFRFKLITKNELDGKFKTVDNYISIRSIVECLFTYVYNFIDVIRFYAAVKRRFCSSTDVSDLWWLVFQRKFLSSLFLSGLFKNIIFVSLWKNVFRKNDPRSFFYLVEAQQWESIALILLSRHHSANVYAYQHAIKRNIDLRYLSFYFNFDFRYKLFYNGIRNYSVVFTNHSDCVRFSNQVNLICYIVPAYRHIQDLKLTYKKNNKLLVLGGDNIELSILMLKETESRYPDYVIYFKPHPALFYAIRNIVLSEFKEISVIDSFGSSDSYEHIFCSLDTSACITFTNSTNIPVKTFSSGFSYYKSFPNYGKDSQLNSDYCFSNNCITLCQCDIFPQLTVWNPEKNSV